MHSKQRVLATLRRQTTDRTPIACEGDGVYIDAPRRRSGTAGHRYRLAAAAMTPLWCKNALNL